MMPDQSDTAVTGPIPTTGPRRSSLVAIVLTVIVTGLGHVYSGHARRAAILYLLSYPVWAVAIGMMVYWPYEHVNALIVAVLLLGYKLYGVGDVTWVTRQQRFHPLRAYQRWWVYPLLLIGSLQLWFFHHSVITPIWVEAYVIPTGGMADTLVPGDRLFAEKQVFLKRPIRHSDVVIFYSNGPGSVVFAQRVIGLPGDRIEFRDEQLIRNGVPINEPYVKLLTVE